MLYSYLYVNVQRYIIIKNIKCSLLRFLSIIIIIAIIIKIIIIPPIAPEMTEIYPGPELILVGTVLLVVVGSDDETGIVIETNECIEVVYVVADNTIAIVGNVYNDPLAVEL